MGFRLCAASMCPCCFDRQDAVRSARLPTSTQTHSYRGLNNEERVWGARYTKIITRTPATVQVIVKAVTCSLGRVLPLPQFLRDLGFRAVSFATH